IVGVSEVIGEPLVEIRKGTAIGDIEEKEAPQLHHAILVEACRIPQGAISEKGRIGRPSTLDVVEGVVVLIEFGITRYPPPLAYRALDDVREVRARQAER